MATATRTFDAALSRNGNSQNSMQLSIPGVLGASLIERGYNRATIEVTAEGLLVKPYHSETKTRTAEKIELPDWDTE